jgi:23S rRNA U2552 (ribose-2'-O)-methylase RlmE/FtsJ
MTYFLLPRSYLHLYKQIEYRESEEDDGILISHSLAGYLYHIKEKITAIEKQWDIYKKYTNPYEYIHTIVQQKKKSVSKYKPISRSYFKMIEMIRTFRLLPETSTPITTFHLAEGPGGFIEALVNMRLCSSDRYIGMTLLDEKKNDANIPGWKKSDAFLKANSNVVIENGITGTGDILSFANFESVVAKYANKKMNIVTADGGFDFSMDFNQQEKMIGKLLFAQMAFALCLNKRQGHFILKIFDCFMAHTLDILYILSSFYEKVYIMKPNTSRYANSERYIVCIGFLYDNISVFYPYLAEAFKKMCMKDTLPGRFLAPISSNDTGIHHFFIKKIEEYNAIFGQKQIHNIIFTLSLIENKTKQEKIESLLLMNIQKSMDWCSRFQVPFHSLNTPTNLFLTDE